MKRQTTRIIKDYRRIGNAALLSRSTNVYNGINGNPTLFANPPVAMADLLQQNTSLEQAMVSAQHRDRLAASKKNAIVSALISMLDKLADWVTGLATDGDPDSVESTLLASGFAVSSAASSGTEEFGPISGFTVTVTQESGSVIVKFQKVPTASSYTYSYGIDNGPNTVWQYINYTKSKLLISGLQAGTVYLFKIEATGPNENSCKSGVISRMVA